MITQINVNNNKLTANIKYANGKVLNKSFTSQEEMNGFIKPLLAEIQKRKQEVALAQERVKLAAVKFKEKQNPRSLRKLKAEEAKLLALTPHKTQPIGGKFTETVPDPRAEWGTTKSKVAKDPKPTVIDEILSLTRLEGNTAQKVEQLNKLFSPVDWKALHESGDPLKMQKRSITDAQFFEAIDGMCESPVAFAMWMRNHFGAMAYDEVDGKVVCGALLVAENGYYPTKKDGKVIFEKAPAGHLGLYAKDALAAAVLFIQLMGIVSCTRYSEGDGEFGTMPPMFTFSEGQTWEIPVGAKVFTPTRVLATNWPFHPLYLGKEDEDAYFSIGNKIEERSKWYRAKPLHISSFEDVTPECFEQHSAKIKLLGTKFQEKVSESLKRKFPNAKVTRAWVKASGMKLIDSFCDRTQVAQALDAFIYATLNPSVLVGTTTTGWQVLKGVFLNDTVSDLYSLQGLKPEDVVAKGTVELPPNLVLCDPVVYAMDYDMSFDEAVFYLGLISSNCRYSYGRDKIETQFKLTYNDNGSVTLGLDDYKFRLTREMEVFDEERELYIRNQLFVNPDLTHSRRKASEDDIALVNPYGALVYGVINNLNVACSSKNSQSLTYNSRSPRWGDLYNAFISGDSLSIDAEEESGGSTQGDRGLWNHYVTKPFTWNGSLCWNFDYAMPRYGKVQKFSGQLDCLTTAARRKYNLAHLPKGNTPFVDGRLAWLHVPARGLNKKLRMRFASLVLTTLTGESDVYKALCSVFPELEHLYESKDLAVKHGLRNFLVALSVKDGKVLKRIGHKFAKHAEPLGPYAREMALVMFGWDEPSLIHSVPGAWAPFAIAPAGQSLRIQGSNDPFLLKSSYKCEKKGTKSYTLKVEGGTKTSSSGSPCWTFDNVVTQGGAVDKPWSVKGIEIKKDDIIMELHYKSLNGEMSTQVVVAPKDCILQEVIVTETMWKQTKVVLKYSLVQTNGKLRGNHKTTVVFTGKAVIYNTMNELYAPGLDSKVELLITGDADKSPDLAMGIMEVVAETLRETEEGRAKIALLNSPLGITNDQHLHWSYHLAVLGLYDEILQEFHAEFLKAVWLQTTDVENNYIRGVREIYLNKAGTAAKPGKANWYAISLAELEAYLGKGTCFPADADNFLVFTNGLEDVSRIKWSKGIAEVQSGEILVFFTKDGVDYMWQRTPMFIGNVNQSVKIPCKPEISTIDQAAGNTTRMMNTVYRIIAGGMKNGNGEYIFAPQPKLADNLAADTVNSINKWAAFQAMAKGLDIKAVAPMGGPNGEGQDFVHNTKQVPMFGLRREEGKPAVYAFSDEFMALVDERLSEEHRKLAKTGLLPLRTLAEIFWDCTFVFTHTKRKGEDKTEVKNLHVYLPALVSQDANPTTTESISGLVLHAFGLAINDSIITQSDGRSLTVRLHAALSSMLESKNAIKKTNQGRVSVQCKAQALPGIPTEEFWVLRTPAPTPYSVYNNLLRVFRMIGFEGDVNGMQVLCTRSPIPFPAVLKVVFKDKPSADKVALAERVLAGDATVQMSVAEAQEVIACCSLQPSQGGFSPLAAQVSGGDNDGDIYVFTPILEKLPLLSYELVDEVITSRTGIGMTAKDQGGYLADHCWVKKWTTEKISNPHLVTKNNIKGFVRPEFSTQELSDMGVSKDDPITKVRSFDGYDRNAECAMQTFSPNVGIAHGMATRAEAASVLMKAIDACGYSASTSVSTSVSTLKFILKYLAADSIDADEAALRVFLSYRLMSRVDAETEAWVRQEVALPMYEYYEGNPLGGLSYYGYCMTEELKQLMYGSKPQEVSTLSFWDTVAEAGMNPNFSYNFQHIAAWCRNGLKFDGAADTSDVNTFLVVASELIHLIGRGQFKPLFITNKEMSYANPHLLMARYFLKWDAGTGDCNKVRQRLCAASPIFQFLYYFVRSTTRLFGETVAQRTAAHTFIGGGADKANIALLKVRELLTK